MIEETAVVISSDERYAEVDANRQTACGSCSNKSGCGTSVLAGVFGNKQARVKVLNKIGAKPGDKVVVGIPEGAFLYSAFALYGIPLLAFLSAAIAGRMVSVYISLPFSVELISIVSGLLGLWGGLALVKRLSDRSEAAQNRQAVILRFQTEVIAMIEQPK